MSTVNSVEDERGTLEFIFKKVRECKDSDELMDIYDKWKNYDENSQLAKYSAPINLAKVVVKFVKNKECSIIDVGCGTGLVGEELRKCGFTGQIDGIDPSTEMIKLATKKDCYGKFFTEFITVDKPCSIGTGSYDHLVTSGTVVPGHVKYQALTELLRMCKKGGYVFVCLREDYLEHRDFNGFKEFMEKLRIDGKICSYEFIGIDKYHLSLPGVVIVLEKMSAK